MTNRLVLVAAMILAFGWANVCSAEEPKPPEPKPEKKEEKKAKKPSERLWPRGPEIEKLKALGLTDEQIAKAKDAVAAVTKKNDELLANKDVAAAEAAVKKAEEALKAAEEKASTAKDNFELTEELKKAVYGCVPDDKKNATAELIKFNPKKAEKKPKAEPKPEKKADEPKAQ